MIFFSFEDLLVFLKKNLEFCFRMVPQRKHAWKGWKVLNTIEKQTIIIYLALPFQGMLWKVHSEFAYGHIKTHLYSPCKNKDGFFFVNFFCYNTWTFLIKFLSHNKILPWFLVHNTFIFFYLGLWFSVIPSYCCTTRRCGQVHLVFH